MTVPTTDINKTNAAVTATARLLAEVLSAHWTQVLCDSEESMELVQRCLDRYRDAAEHHRQAGIHYRSLLQLAANPRMTLVDDGTGRLRPPTDAEAFAARNRPPGGNDDRPHPT